MKQEETTERMVNERTASLREAIAQMEEFSYSVSHDLRAPVRAMQCYAEVLMEDYGAKLDDTAKKYLDRIIRGGTRMDRLIQDILTYSRLSRREIQLHPISLDKLTREIVHQYRDLNSKANAEISVDGHLLAVIGHEASLSQAISNLVNNAVKFVAPGTVPKVRVRTERRNGDVRSSGSKTAWHRHQTLETSTPPLQRVRADSSGTKLRRHRHWFGHRPQSRRTHGRKDRRRIRWCEWQQILDSIARGGNSKLMNSPLILLAEDDDNDIFFMRRALRKAEVDFPLQIVTNGQEAVDYLGGTGKFADRANYPLPSVMLLDLKMPFLDGFEVLTWINSQPSLKEIPVVVLTSSAEERDRQKATALGATGYFGTPPSIATVRRAMRSS